MQVKGDRFFEIYNGHPGVNNGGDATRLGMDAMWDARWNVLWKAPWNGMRNRTQAGRYRQALRKAAAILRYGPTRRKGAAIPQV